MSDAKPERQSNPSPRVAGSEAHAADETSVDSGSGESIRVLLVEDTPNDAHLLHRMLKDHRGPFVVSWVSDLASSLDTLRTQPFDIVLLDLGLPDSWGLSTFSAVHTEAPHIPIVVLSSLDDESVAVRAVRDGAQDYLVKGACDAPLLARAIRYAIERKRAAEAIRRLNVELEHRVAERTSQLEAMVSELEAFSYSVSHDLRGPLRGINGFSHALLEDYGDVLDERGKHYLHRLREATWRMGELIDALLNLSRVMRGSLQRRGVDLSEMARILAAELQQTDPARQVQWKIAGGLHACGDEALLRLLLANLLGNALKFTRRERIATITFSCDASSGRRVFAVRDNGAGFDMRYVDKIFRPFQRLHGATEFEGSGIGLAIAQRVVFRHGGEIWAEGAIDAGTSFYFTLPDPEAGEDALA